MNENKYPDYIELLKLRKKLSIYQVAALTLGIDPRYLKIFPSYNTQREYYTYENFDEMPQNWYYPLKADQCSIEKYEELELENGFLAPVDGCSKLGDYSQGSKDFLFQELKKSLIEGVKNQEIKIKFISENTQEIELKNLSEARLVEVEEVKKWFKKHNFSSPFFESPKDIEGLPQYLDRNHLEHASELRIAIEAWQRFSGLGVSHPKKYVEEWLAEFYGQKKPDDNTQERISKNGIERIAMLVNWRPDGGTDTQGFKKNIYQQALDKDLS